MHRRHFVHSTAGAGVAAMFPLRSLAQAALPRRLRMLIPAAPGVSVDTFGRALSHALVASGQAVSCPVENRPGKGGIVGLTQFAERFSLDPAALLVAGFAMTGAMALHESTEDFSQVTPIARLVSEFLVVVVPSRSPLRTLGDLVAELRKGRGKLPFGGVGAGTVDHVFAAMLLRGAAIDAAGLAYQPLDATATVLNALDTGRIAAAVGHYGDLKEAIGGGSLRALGISSRRAAFGIPSLNEQGVKVELANSHGVFAGGGIGVEEALELRQSVERAVQHRSWHEAVVRNSWQPAWLVGRGYADTLEIDMALARIVVRLLHLKRQ